MSLGLTIDISDPATALLGELLAGLEDRTQLHEAIAGEARALTREHLQMLADTRHKTAEELGAEPTGFLAEAVERVSSSADNSAAHIGIQSPGIGRAAHDVTIVPTDGHEFLTIPVHPLAYGHRASELRRDLDTFVVKVHDQLVIGFKTQGQNILTTLYLLLPEVHLDQDRTLLPSDEEYELAALEGINTYVDLLLAGKAAA